MFSKVRGLLASRAAYWPQRLAEHVMAIATPTAEDAAIDKGLRWSDQMERAVHDELIGRRNRWFPP